MFHSIAPNPDFRRSAQDLLGKRVTRVFRIGRNEGKVEFSSGERLRKPGQIILHAVRLNRPAFAHGDLHSAPTKLGDEISDLIEGKILEWLDEADEFEL